MEAEKKKLEEKERLKNAGIVGSTMDAVGSGVKLVGTGVGMVGSGLGAGASVVGSGVGIVGSGLGKAGKRLGRVVTRHASSNKLTSPATASPVSASPMHQQNGSFRYEPISMLEQFSCLTNPGMFHWSHYDLYAGCCMCLICDGLIQCVVLGFQGVNNSGVT
jgi:hypothetical protein